MSGRTDALSRDVGAARHGRFASGAHHTRTRSRGGGVGAEGAREAFVVGGERLVKAAGTGPAVGNKYGGIVVKW